MKRYHTKKIVPHSPSNMFQLVSDVENYPSFVPLCEKMRVINRQATAPGIVTLVAEMTVGFKAVCERYSSKVVCDESRSEINVSAIDGPFRRLNTCWRFTDASDDESSIKRCFVDFSIEYEFKSLALGLIMGAMFDKAVHNYTEAFAKRADIIFRSQKI
jgi:coenzyme Q-binding protein COQ10